MPALILRAGFFISTDEGHGIFCLLPNPFLKILCRRSSKPHLLSFIGLYPKLIKRSISYLDFSQNSL
jgi:hypothetical protein